MMKNRVLIFIISTYFLTFVYSLLYIFFPYDFKNNISFWITSFYMFIPLLSTIFLQKIIYKEDLKNIGFNLKWSWWYLFSIFFPIVLNLLSFLVSLLFKDISFSPDMSGMIERYQKFFTEDQLKLMREQIEKVPSYVFFLGTLLQIIFFGTTVNTIFAFGEEAGWRGFMLENLRNKNFYFASFIIGVVWGIWHFPVIIQGHNYPEHRIIGVFMMILWCMLLSPFFSYVVEKTGTVLSAAIMHGVLNASYGLSIMYLKGGNDLTAGVTSFSGIIVLFILNIIFYFYLIFFDRKILFKEDENNVNLNKGGE